MPNSKFILLCEDDKIALDFLNIYKAQYPSIKVCYFPAHDSLPFSTEKSSEQILLDRSKSLIDINKNEVIIITCNNLLKLIEINKGVELLLRNRRKPKPKPNTFQLKFSFFKREITIIFNITKK